MPIATIKCPSCSSNVNIPINAFDIFDYDQQEAITQSQCPRCKTKFDLYWSDIPQRIQETIVELRKQDEIEDVDEERFNTYVAADSEDVIDQAVTKADSEFLAAAAPFEDESIYEISQIDAEHIVSDQRLRELSEAFAGTVTKKLKHKTRMSDDSAQFVGDISGQIIDQVSTTARKKVEESDIYNRVSNRIRKFF